MNAIVQHASGHSGALVPGNMGDAMRLAEMMARSKMLPAHFHNSPGDCLMVVEQAMRWNMSPFAVAQCASNIKGKLMFEGKLIAAAIENSGAIAGLLDYQFSGEGQNRKITVTGTRVGESDPRSVEVVLKDVVTENGVWKKQPDQQLVYSGARIWGRRWTPGVVLGVYAPEEFAQAQAESFAGTTIEGSAAAHHTEPAQITQETAKKQTVSQWLDALEAELWGAENDSAVDLIVCREDVQKALDKLTNGGLARLKDMIGKAQRRTSADDFPGTVTRDDAEMDAIAQAVVGTGRLLGAG